MELIGWPQAS